MKYRADIDGLRAVAVLAVLGFHAAPAFIKSGFIGVDIFFVISGYLITSIILADVSLGRFSVLDFYRRRVKRIFPALVLVLLASLVVGWFLLFSLEYALLGKNVAAGVAFVANFVLWNDSGYFAQEAASNPMLHLWSLAVEEQFYLVWPLILIFLIKKFHLMASVLLFLISFVFGLYLLSVDSSAAFYWSVARFWELAVGGALAVAMVSRIDFFDRWKLISSAAGFFLLTGSFLLIESSSSFPGWIAAFPVIGAALIISAGPDAGLNRWILSGKVLVFVGLISYPLYLWHWPVLTFYRLIVGEQESVWVTALVLAFTFFVSWVTYAFVEKRLRMSRSRWVVPSLVGSMLVVGAMALVIVAENGFEGRSIDRQLDFGAAGDVIARTRKTDRSCVDLLGKTLTNEEVCFASTSKPEILFVGDSHAMALYSSIHSGVRPMSAALVAAHACQPFSNLDFISPRKRSFGNNCGEISKEILKMAQSLESVNTIVVSSSFFYLNEKMSGHYRGAVALSNKEAFYEGNLYMLNEFLKLGKKVVFVVDPPHLKYAPENCVKRVLISDSKHCGLTFAEHAEVRGEYMQKIDSFRDQFPELSIYDPTEIFCDEVRCHSFRDGLQLYNDRHHVSLHASKIMLNEMVALELLE